MDALSLIPMERTDGYWIGRLSVAVGYGTEHTDKHAREVLRECLAEFIASPVPSEELRKALRGYLK
jgi:hypothetical protein